MCGIAGFIGQSKKPKLSYELITALFDYLELRGTDASGLWGTEVGKKGRIVYHKEPVRSSQFIKGDFWKQLRKIKMDMLIVHARATSKGGGHASCNSNNHPFTSADKRLGMVHNGTLDEAVHLKNRFKTVSDTDSEFLLRIYESGLEADFDGFDGVSDDICNRINATKDIWSYISSGAMAVALGERVDDETRCLTLFRNDKRPLWVADLRSLLGQVFFFSSPDIWYKAVSNNLELKKMCWSSQKLIEVPADQIWFMQINKDAASVNEGNFYKFSLNVTSSKLASETVETVVEMQPAKTELKVLSKLNEHDELPHAKKETKRMAPTIIHNQRLWDQEEDVDDCGWEEAEPQSYAIRNDHDALCGKIRALINNIAATTTNLVDERSISTHDYEELIESLEQTRQDLAGTLQILSS